MRRGILAGHAAHATRRDAAAGQWMSNPTQSATPNA